MKSITTVHSPYVIQQIPTRQFDQAYAQFLKATKNAAISTEVIERTQIYRN